MDIFIRLLRALLRFTGAELAHTGVLETGAPVLPPLARASSRLEALGLSRFESSVTVWGVAAWPVDPPCCSLCVGCEEWEPRPLLLLY